MRLSTVLELLAFFGLLAYAAAKAVDTTSLRSPKTKVQTKYQLRQVAEDQVQNVANKYCSCSDNICDCCRDFQLPLVSLNGPGCATFQYLNGDNMALSMRFGDRVLANTTISGRRPRPVCMPLPGGFSKFCGRVYGISRAEENFKACLGLELQSSDELEAAVRVSCFRFGPQGLDLAPAEPLPVRQEAAPEDEDDDDDDDDDDDFGLGLGGDDDDDDDDDDDFGLGLGDDDDDDDDEEAAETENEVDSADYTGFSLLSDDFLGGLFGGGSSTKKKIKKKTAAVPTRAPLVISTTTAKFVRKPLRKKAQSTTTTTTSARPVKYTQYTQTFKQSTTTEPTLYHKVIVNNVPQFVVKKPTSSSTFKRRTTTQTPFTESVSITTIKNQLLDVQPQTQGVLEFAASPSHNEIQQSLGSIQSTNAGFESLNKPTDDLKLEETRSPLVEPSSAVETPEIPSQEPEIVNQEPITNVQDEQTDEEDQDDGYITVGSDEEAITADKEPEATAHEAPVQIKPDDVLTAVESHKVEIYTSTVSPNLITAATKKPPATGLDGIVESIESIGGLITDDDDDDDDEDDDDDDENDDDDDDEKESAEKDEEDSEEHEETEDHTEQEDEKNDDENDDDDESDDDDDDDDEESDEDEEEEPSKPVHDTNTTTKPKKKKDKLDTFGLGTITETLGFRRRNNKMMRW